MSNELCKSCLTPLDFGVASCGCNGERIAELEKALVEIAGMTLHRHTLGHAVEAAKKELARGSDER